MGAVEIAMRLAGNRKTEHILEPVLGMVFDSKEEGYEFYNMYSWESGFGIVYSKCVRRQSDPDYRSMQQLRCERSGSDPRVSGSTKKINCKARLKMLRDKDGGWYVSEFVKEHNHPFAESCSEKREWFSHKRLDPYTLGIIKYLRANNVNQTGVRCIIGSMFGSLKGAPCTKRTVRSICNQIAREQMDDDVAKTLELLNDKEFYQATAAETHIREEMVDECNDDDMGEDKTSSCKVESESSRKRLGGTLNGIELDDTNAAWQIVLYQGDNKNNDFCPTPISVRKHISNEVTDISIRKTMFINDIEVDITEMKTITNFGMSPFVISMTQKDSGLEKIFGLQRAMTELQGDDYDMVWYMHNIPRMIKIEGRIIHSMMQSCNDYTIDVMDGLVRMYKQMDDEMYERWSEKRWRHFLPTDFAVAALKSDIDMGSTSVEDLFMGNHISYNVGDCRLIIATIMVHWDWCLYVRDFQRLKIIVLDPVSMTDGDSVLVNKHSTAVSVMHDAMRYCKEHFFPYPEQCMDDWQVEYIDIKGANGSSNESGLYTMFYARYFDGEILTRILTRGVNQGTEG